MNCPDCELPDPEHQMRCRLRGNPLYLILFDLLADLRDDSNYTLRPVLADWAEARLRDTYDTPTITP